MKLKDIFKRIVFYLSVPKCVMCEERLDYGERALCPRCLSEYQNHKERNCSRCAKRLNSCSCTSKYLDRHYVKRVSKVFRYTKTRQDTAWNYLIYSLKQDNRRDVFDFLSDELVCSIRNTTPRLDEQRSSFLITNVPRRRGAVREYGYDHARELAKRVAKKLGIKYVALLKSKTKKAQKTTFGEDRVKNVSLDYARACPKCLKGKQVIIVDDIITTGASVGAAATLIRGLGTKKIYAASVSIAYHDLYKPFMLPYEAKRYKSKYYFNRKKRTYIR